jgi:hypothetical protein
MRHANPQAEKILDAVRLASDSGSPGASTDACSLVSAAAALSKGLVLALDNCALYATRAGETQQFREGV